MVIRLRDIQCYAYHGVLEEEKQKGNTFLVNVCITVDDPQGMPSDDIQDTLDYRSVCAIVNKEMQVPSDLLEHVAWRIKNALQLAFPQIEGTEYVLWLDSITVRKPERQLGAVVTVLIAVGAVALSCVLILLLHKLSTKKKRAARYRR